MKYIPGAGKAPRSSNMGAAALAWLGGDEFTVVLTKMNVREDTGRLGSSLLEVLAKPFVIDDHEFTISASIGIGIFPENGADGIDLLHQADGAMYTAKRNGRTIVNIEAQNDEQLVAKRQDK